MSMDYEKAYKDALERAKEIHDSPNASSGRKEWLESIFPELAESEDERIRKDMISYIGGLNHKEKAKWIAYLEKQKEQKPIIADRELTDFEMEVHEIVAQAMSDKRLNKADILRQFEQEATLVLMTKARKELEQKPAEWSEEDERIRQGLLEMYMREHLVSVPIGVHSKDIIHFLENLRPHWKPSEEQMEVLKEAVFYFGDSWVSHKQEELESLYNDLKKLM